MHWQGSVAMVTGAGSGLGRALAEELALRGCRLALLDKDRAGLSETVSRVGGSPLAETVDVADRQAMEHFGQRVRDECGIPDVVINNAALAQMQRIVNLDMEEFELVQRINVLGVVLGSRLFLSEMLDRGSGVIVNIASYAALIGMPAAASYCTSKHAVSGFTACLRAELAGTGVRALAVYPGLFQTGMVNNMLYHESFDDTMTREDFSRAMRDEVKTAPDTFARAILQGIEKRKTHLLLGADAKAVALMMRLMPVRVPALLVRLLKRRARH